MGHLAEHSIDALQPVLGRVLEGLCLRAFDCDVQSESDLAVDGLYIGGELRLDFTGRSLFVSWVQGLYTARDPSAIVEEDCSIAARATSFFPPVAELVEWDLAHIEPWNVLIGGRLESAKVLGLARFPNIIGLKVGGKHLLLANSSEWQLGLGTDLLIAVRPGLTPHSANKLWADGTAAT